jgi:hypothetical protein
MTSPPELPEQPPPPTVTSTLGGRFSLVLTNLGKLAGLVGGIHEAAGPARYSAILFWVAIFLGAQAVEDLISRLIDRAMGK